MHRLLNTRRMELILGSALFSIFLAANLGTSSRSPVIWQDEVMFTDPAANLYFGQGFTTSAWFQTRDTLFAGNSPLYSLCLYPWIRVFGFDVVSVRGLNYLLILAVVAVCLLALNRLGLVRSTVPRIAFALLVLCGDGVTYSYRSGRYDCLGMLLVSGLFLTLTLRPSRLRTTGSFVIAALAPWAGLQLLPYLALLGLLLLLMQGKTALGDVLTVGLGCLAGLASLAALLLENGVGHEFLKSVSILAGSGRSIAERLSSAMVAPFTEPSSILLLMALGVILVATLRRGEFRLRTPLGLGLLAGLFVPCFLALAGKYARYYCWMAFIPMAACMAAELQSCRLGAVRKLVLPLLLLACAAGLPARLAVTCREWSLRDPAPVDQIVAEQIQSGDWVYSEYEAYYPAKKTAAVLFLPPYAGLVPGMKGHQPALSAADRERVSLLILKPSTEQETLQFFGGRWSLVGHYDAAGSSRGHIAAVLGKGSPPYEIHVYRRRPATVALAR